jgi:hypothetical protein
LCNTEPDLDLGVGAYRLAGLLRMGIVVLEYLKDLGVESLTTEESEFIEKLGIKPRP